MRNKNDAEHRVSGVLAKAFLACIICTMLVAVLTGLTRISNTVTIHADGQTYSKYTIYETLEEILEQEQLTLGANDTYTFTGFHDSQATLTIVRAFDVTVKADGSEQTLVMTEGTTADALAKANITLSDNDTVNLKLDQELKDGMDIEVTRISYEEYQETTEIPFTVVEPEGTLADGDSIITATAGENGEKVTTYRRTFVNGQETEVKLIADEVTKQPVAEVQEIKKAEPKPVTPVAKEEAPVVNNSQPASGSPEIAPDSSSSASSSGSTTMYYVGGQPVYCNPGEAPVELDANGNPVNYQYKINGKATAYSALGRPTKLVPGCVAMDLSKYPKGTMLYIKTPDGGYIYGYSRVADTGEFVNTTDVLVDVFFNSYEESRQFGAKYVDVYVL